MRPIDADEVTRDLASFKYSKEYGEEEEVYNRERHWTKNK